MELTFIEEWNVWLPFIGYVRIPIPFTNQLSTWEHIQKTYLNKFPLIWVKFGQSKGLFDWANQNNKHIWYYTEENDVKKLLIQIEGI